MENGLAEIVYDAGWTNGRCSRPTIAVTGGIPPSAAAGHADGWGVGVPPMNAAAPMDFGLGGIPPRPTQHQQGEGPPPLG